MNAVLGLANIGQRNHSIEKNRELFEKIYESGHNLFRVVNDILDFSKIEAGKLTLEHKAFNLTQSIQKVIELISFLVKKKGLKLILDYNENLAIWVYGDSLRIEQVLINLFSNAVKFTQQGQICFRLIQDANHFKFSVKDTGIGISNDQLVRLFTPFEQADKSTTRQYGGTGLGLSISRDLTTMMGGKLSVHSKLGAGSEFILQLDLQPAEERQPPSTHTPSLSHRLHDLNILVAEDIELNRMVLEDMLIHEGAGVSFAHNGQEVLEMVSKAPHKHFDIVLMDIQMPVMDGHEATQKLCQLFPNLPVIGLTAHALNTEKQRCLESGMVDHIAKPIDIDELVTAILNQVKSASTDS